MGDTPNTAVDALAKAQARYSQKELLIRYARGRVAHVWARQTMTALGVVVLCFSNGPARAVAALGLAILGELVDCLYLRRIIAGLADETSVRRAYWLSAVTAAFQALTIAGCVALGWFGPVSHSAPLFALSFLLGTAINAGVVLPYHRAAGMARLGIYSATLLILLVGELALYGAVTRTLALNAAGAAMLIYMAVAFLFFVNDGFEKNRARTLDTVQRGMDVSALNDQLLAQRKELSLLSLVARHANDSMIISKPGGIVSFVNDAFTRTTGYAPEDIIGKRLRDVLLFDRSDRDVLAQIIKSGDEGFVFRGEIELLSKDGTPFWYEVNQVPVLDAHGAVETIVSVNRDITDAKSQEAELIAAKQASENSARAKAEFLATMSHEIRTPMNGIMGMADLLMGSELDKEQRLYAETIRGSSQGLLSIINDILDLSKLDAKKMSLMTVDFCLRECLEASVQLLAPEAKAKAIDLRLWVDDTVPEQVHGDDARLRQILLNLIGNAVKFTDDGHVHVSASIAQSASDLVLTVIIEDTGIGIAPDKLDHVFERFSQAEASTTRRFGGTGLGLTISKLLAEQMGGGITVTSTEGKGARFTLTARLLPATCSAPKQTVEGDKVNALDTIRGLKVLVAEDNQVNRILMQKYLADADVTLTFAADGAEAVALAIDTRPDVIFMDMSMPVMDGLEATRQIRKSAPHRPVIVALTANAFPADRSACLDAGMDGFLSKPVRRQDILTQLSHIRTVRPATD